MIRPVVRDDLPELVELFRELWPDIPLTLEDVEPIPERYISDDMKSLALRIRESWAFSR